MPGSVQRRSSRGWSPGCCREGWVGCTTHGRPLGSKARGQQGRWAAEQQSLQPLAAPMAAKMLGPGFIKRLNQQLNASSQLQIKSIPLTSARSRHRPRLGPCHRFETAGRGTAGWSGQAVENRDRSGRWEGGGSGFAVAGHSAPVHQLASVLPYRLLSMLQSPTG